MKQKKLKLYSTHCFVGKGTQHILRIQQAPLLPKYIK